MNQDDRIKELEAAVKSMDSQLGEEHREIERLRQELREAREQLSNYQVVMTALYDALGIERNEQSVLEKVRELIKRIVELETDNRDSAVAMNAENDLHIQRAVQEDTCLLNTKKD